MKPFAEVLTDTKPTAEKLDRSNDLSNMQVHGSIIEDGRMIIPSTEPNQRMKEDPESKTRLQSGDRCERSIPISKCADSQYRLRSLVTACFNSLNTYGATNDALEASVTIMQMILGKYEYPLVRKAFEVHMVNSPDMPKPADIVKIINPPAEKRKWRGDVYIQLCKQRTQGQFMSDEELEYIADYERAAMTGECDGGAIQDAKRVNKQYWLQ